MTASDSRADWWTRAACSTSDPDLFFPVSSCGPALLQVQLAKETCASCQIQQACLDYALDAGPVQGVWGGTTEEERQQLRRSARRAGAYRRRRPNSVRIAGLTAPACAHPLGTPGGRDHVVRTFAADRNPDQRRGQARQLIRSLCQAGKV